MKWTIREVNAQDDLTELAKVLNELSPAEFDVVKVRLALDVRKARGAYTFVAVLESGEICGTASLVTERKLLAPDCKLIGRIEEVVVKNEYRSLGIGAELVRYCFYEAYNLGCRKLLLQAAEHNVPFYEKLGFRRHEVNMRMDIVYR